MTKRHAKTTRTESAAWRAPLAAAAALLAVPSLPAEEPAREETGAPTAPEVVDSSSGRDPAVTTFPNYPPIARRDRIEGEATVCFRIAPDGRILEASVTRSTHKIFEKPALEAIRASSFEPLLPDQEVTPTPVCRTYRFRLDPVTEPA